MFPIPWLTLCWSCTARPDWLAHEAVDLQTNVDSRPFAGLGRIVRMGVLREDVRVEPGRAQMALDGERIVAHGIAVGEGGHELVDGAGHETHHHRKE